MTDNDASSDSEKQSPIEGNGSGVRVYVDNADNSASDHINKCLSVSVHTLPGPPKPPRALLNPDSLDEPDILQDSTGEDSVKIDFPSPNTRRKISLTPELQKKSPMIGRRGIDISEKFLRSFSDSSSSEESEETDDEMDLKRNVEEMSAANSLEMPPISRKNLALRLSVIEEDLSEDSATLQRRKNTKSEAGKLKLVLKTDGERAKDDCSKGESGTPVTPDKYNDNWEQFGAQTNAGNYDSWSSEPHSAGGNNPTADTNVVTDEGSDDELDANASFAETSIVSPKPVFKKIDSRRAALKKKSSGSSNASLPDTESPSTNLFFRFPNPQPQSTSLSTLDSPPQTPVHSSVHGTGEGFLFDLNTSPPNLLSGVGATPEPLSGNAEPIPGADTHAVNVGVGSLTNSSTNQVVLEENQKDTTQQEGADSKVEGTLHKTDLSF